MTSREALTLFAQGKLDAEAVGRVVFSGKNVETASIWCRDDCGNWYDVEKDPEGKFSVTHTPNRNPYQANLNPFQQ